MTSTVDPFEGLAITVKVAGKQTIIGTRGEVDQISAPELAVALDLLIDRGHRTVVVDLAECSFIGTSGLRAIAGGAQRLGLVGGALTVRSPSATVRRLVNIMGMPELILEERPEPASFADSVQSTRLAPIEIEVGSQCLPPYLKRIMTVASNDDVVNSVLRLVVTLASITVGGADGVSVSLRRDGRLVTVASSDQTVSDMDACQYATGEGPCVDASADGWWVHAGSLTTETRWPTFTPNARALGINAVMSSPLWTRNDPVGALNIYSRVPAVFAPKDQEMTSAFAAEASIVLFGTGMAMIAAQLARQLDEVLQTRETIAQARRVLMDRDRIEKEDASTMLHRSSLRTGGSLREQAEDPVASTRRSRLGSGPEQARERNG